MVDDTTQVLELCHALQAAGLWLTLHDADTLVRVRSAFPANM